MQSKRLLKAVSRVATAYGVMTQAVNDLAAATTDAKPKRKDAHPCPSYQQLERFVRDIARMTKDGELDADKDVFVQENDDAVDTLTSLIDEARGFFGIGDNYPEEE